MSILFKPSALRDLRAHLVQPPVFTVMAGVAIVLGLSGPFNTWETLPFGGRLVYWSLIVLGTYTTGFIITTRVQPFVRDKRAVVRTGAITLAVALPVYAVLLAINLAFAQAPTTVEMYLRSFGIVVLICLVIEVSNQALAASAPAAPATMLFAATTTKPALLARLPLQKRGALVSVSVQDHYVDVTTTTGTHVLLLRLSDAIGETLPVVGMQVHRSHWVAVDHIVAVRRCGEGAVLTMRHGPDVPVSRAFLPRLRDAGLLPRKGV